MGDLDKMPKLHILVGFFANLIVAMGIQSENPECVLMWAQLFLMGMQNKTIRLSWLINNFVKLGMNIICTDDTIKYCGIRHVKTKQKENKRKIKIQQSAPILVINRHHFRTHVNMLFLIKLIPSLFIVCQKKFWNFVHIKYKILNILFSKLVVKA